MKLGEECRTPNRAGNVYSLSKPIQLLLDSLLLALLFLGVIFGDGVEEGDLILVERAELIL